MRSTFVKFVALVALSLLSACTVSAQTKQPVDVKVKTPTRLDWEFVAKHFGPAQAKLPADYDSIKQRYLLFVPKNRPGAAWPCSRAQRHAGP
jgi:hypothetical protein